MTKKYIPLIITFLFFISIGYSQTITFTWTDPTCSSPANGSLTISISGYSGSFEYNLINTTPVQIFTSGTTSAVSYTFNNLSSTGSYVAYVNRPDSEGGAQLAIKNKTLTLVPFIATTNRLKGAGCHGEAVGSVDVDVSGGVAPFSYDWNNGAGYPNSTVISSVPAGAYSVKITDGVGCQITSSTTNILPENLMISNTINKHVLCKGESTGRATAVATNGNLGYTYRWSDGSFGTTNTNLAAGNYYVMAEDGYGCTDTAWFTINEPLNKINLSLDNTENLKCKGVATGEAELSTQFGNAPLTYNWSDGETGPTRTDLSAIAYTVTVTDATFCSDFVNFTLTEPATKITGSVVSSTLPLCFGDKNGTAVINATGGTPGYTYTWNDPGNVTTLHDAMRTDLGSMIYKIAFVDANNCTDTVTFNLAQPGKLTPTLLQADNSAIPAKLLCFEDTLDIKVDIVGGTLPIKSYQWSNPLLPASASVRFGSGTQNVIVTDANDCVASKSVTVTEPTKLLNPIDKTTNPIICNGGKGRLISTANGGTPPYNYAWSNGSVIWNTGQIVAGNYTLNLSDANGCTETTTVNLPEPTAIDITINMDEDLCKDITKGILDAQATGGTEGNTYDFVWSTGSTNDTISNLDYKKYFVEVTDDNACKVIDSIDLSTINQFSITFSMQKVKCAGQSNGSAVAIPQHGFAPYDYVWSNGVTTNTISNLTEGWYTVTVTDANNCVKVDSIYVSTIPSVYVASSGIIETACVDPIGTAWVKVAGGKTPYSYAWSNGGTTDSIINLPVDFYSVLITDANNCTTSKTLYVDDTSKIEVKAISDQLKIKCAGRGDGIATAKGNLGTPPYNFLWSEGTADDTAKNLVAGLYTIEITDVNSCKAKDTIRFIEENVLRVSISDSSMITCFQANDGWAFVTAQGGIGPFSVSWDNGKTTNLITQLPIGVYVATVTDANACAVSDQITITQPAKLQTTIDNTTSISCGGKCDAHARVLATGGTIPYDYNWSSTETDSAAVGLCGGKQYVWITDKNGCETSDSVIIVDTIPRIGLTIADMIQPDCGIANGKLAVDPFGGIQPYSYAWANSDVDSVLDNVLADPYALTITDSKGCELDTILVLDDNSGITLTFERQAITFCTPGNEKYKVTANNGTAPYLYTWSNGDIGNIADSLSTQLYSVSVLDANLCKRSKVVNVVEKPIQINLKNKTNVLCYGTNTGELEIEGLDGISTNYTYNWSNGFNGSKNTNLKAGIYGVTVLEDSSVCPVTRFYTITENPELKRFFSTKQASYCKDSTGVLQLDLIGGVAPYTYLWETGETSNKLSNAWPDYIKIDITDSKGCIVKDSAIVDDISDFSITEKNRDLISCLDDTDGSLEIKLDNGYGPFKYSWSHNVALNNPKATNLGKGIYTVTVVDNKKCKVQHTFNALKNPDTIKITFQESEPIFCNNGTGSLEAITTGGHPYYTYSWARNGISIPYVSNLAEDVAKGNFSVIATDSRGCISPMATYVMNEPPKIQAKFTVKLTGCASLQNSGEIQLDTIIGNNPPYRFRWHDETTNYTWYDDATNIKRTGLPKGEYFFSVYDSLGLCYEVFKNYTNPYIVTDIDTVITQTHCNYYTSADMVAKTPNGSIDITQIVTKHSNYNDPTLSEIVTDFSKYKIVWDDPYDQTTSKASNLPEGVYSVSFLGENKCISTLPAGKIEAQVNLTSKIFDVSDTVYNAKTICIEDSIQLEAAGEQLYKFGYTPANATKTYNWNSITNNSASKLSSNITKNIWVDPLTSYYVDSTKISMEYLLDGCLSPISYYAINHFDSLDFKIEVLDKFENYLGTDSVFAIQKEECLINPTEVPWYVSKPIDEDGIMSIAWSSQDVSKQTKGELNDTITNESTYISSTKYGLMLVPQAPNYIIGIATTTHGCKEKSTVFVNVYKSVFVPSGITPNNDGINDEWVIPYLFMCPDAHVAIYNRWGVKVYENESTYYKNPWKGTNKNNKVLPMGTYYYIIEYNDINNSAPQAGAISILH